MVVIEHLEQVFHSCRRGFVSGAIPGGVQAADDRAVREIEDAIQIAERSSDDWALAFSQVTLGVALVHRQTDAERDQGQMLLAEVSEVFLRWEYVLEALPVASVYVARRRLGGGDG